MTTGAIAKRDEARSEPSLLGWLTCSEENKMASRGEGYEDVRFEEELEYEREATEGEVAEYRRMLELARRANHTRVNDLVRNIIASQDEPVDDLKENVNAIVEYCVGPESDWSSGTGEAEDFRRLVTDSFDVEWKRFRLAHPDLTIGQAMRTLPPKYFALPLPLSQLEALSRANSSPSKPGVGVVRARIQYHDNRGHLCHMVREIPFTLSASMAIDGIVRRIHEVLNVGGVEPSEYFFKVVGRNDFIYGPESFISFRSIRDCVVKQNEVNLYVMRLPMPSAALEAPRFKPTYEKKTSNTVTPLGQTIHDSLSSANLFNSWDAKAPLATQSFSLWEIRQPVTVDITELTNVIIPPERVKAESLREGDDVYLCAVVELCFGGRSVAPPQRTPWRCLRHLAGSSRPEHVLWGNSGRLTFDVQLCDVPRELRLCISVVCVGGDQFTAELADYTAKRLIDDTAHKQEEKLADFVNRINPMSFLTKGPESTVKSIFYLANVNSQLFDHTGRLKCGPQRDVRMWASEVRANPIAISSSNPDATAMALHMVYPKFQFPIVHPGGHPPEVKRRQLEVAHHDRMMDMDLAIRDNKIAQLRHIKRILATDPLYEVAPMERVLLWQYRNDLTRRPKALAKLLLAVDWMSPAAVAEAHQLMDRWAVMQPVDALELLDARYSDTKVREYAIACLDTMPDNELRSVLLQLVQVLKYEPYHYSALARFLLRRSLASPHFIGHTVFWHLKAEMYNPSVSERHGVIMVEYLTRLQSRRDTLRQVHVVQLLLSAALKIKESRKDERLSDLREAIHKIEFPPSFTLALNPTMQCTGLHVSKCKVMDSKKLPLWLVFRNADPLGNNIFVMFKAGDDLRQDLLTLQMLELMDNVWKGTGLDLHMIPYGCVATGEGVGMIEIVLKSDTIANITRRDGGAQAAFSEEPLMNWLRKYNRTPTEVEKCLWNFVYSTAGYCVATYILGIGDRHNDNIMVREDGTLFHIDFGHFLGNFKTKFGFKRETAPFIFTPMYAYMMGGPNSPIYAHFVDIACEAFNVIRRQTNLLITLFMLMLSTGIPELQRASDIMWLKTVLMQEATDDVAAKYYRVQIQAALENKRTLINDYIHIVAHT
jgi:hypothetical protein